jgi:EAL domain-containing protein (putative c-di-GMP-specific phosphodiesterase class I)/FixJ family two-component response regulator/GGDEF domain-containing protein
MKRKILLVDDEVNILRALERLLRRHGFDVFCASDTSEALKIQHEQHCPVVISDFRMPHANGAELLQQIKQQHPHTVGMILSAYADFSSVVATLNSGVAFKFLQKPWLEVSLLEDIEQAFLQYEQQKNAQLRTSLLIGSKDALIEFDRSGVVKRFNASAQHLLQLSAVELSQAVLSSLFRDLSVPALVAFLQKQQLSLAVETYQGTQLELIHQFSDSGHLLLRLEASTASAAAGQTLATAAELLDREQLIHATDLALSSQQGPLALVYLDIKNFNDIHHAIDFAGADQLVSALAETLIGQLSRHGQVAYLFADQFVLLLSAFGHEANLLSLVQNALSRFEQPIAINNIALHVSFNIGYSMAPDDSNDAKTMLEQARLAARSHTGLSGTFMMRFDQSYVAARQRHYAISNALFEAISQQSFQLCFQPKVRLADGEIRSAEVLLRWHDAKLGTISPAVFIPIAERDGQINAIGFWVLKQSLQQLQQWQQQGLELPQLAVNVSAVQLKDPHFVPQLTLLLQQMPSVAHLLELELTETTAVQQLEDCAKLLMDLRAAGLKIAIDDFGSGYSSLAYLNRLPVDVVKLDRSLIVDLDHSLPAQSMVRHIIRMTQELNIQVVAEGVESEIQLELLHQMHCDYVQGFVFSKPLQAPELQQLLQQQPFRHIAAGGHR